LDRVLLVFIKTIFPDVQEWFELIGGVVVDKTQETLYLIIVSNP
jgi:hypothetical protein